MPTGPLVAELAAAGAALAAGAPAAGAGSPLADAVFAHAVNDAEALRAALAAPSVTLLEGDVVVATAAAAAGQPPLAVMGHDPGCAHDLEFHAWAHASAAAGRGVKVDVKQAAATAGVLAALRALDAEAHRGGVPAWPLLRFDRAGAEAGGPREFVTRPAVLVNADVLSGTARCVFFDGGAPGGGGGGAPAERGRAVERQDSTTPQHSVRELAAAAAWVEAVSDALPAGHVLSLGWATAGEHGSYTAAMVDDMLALAGLHAATGAPVTFAVRGSYVVASWPQLRRLLDAGPFTSLTVWSNVPLAPLEEAWLREHLPPTRVAWDVPPQPAPTAGTAPPLPAPPVSSDSPRAWRLRALAAATAGAAAGAVAIVLIVAALRGASRSRTAARATCTCTI